MYIRKGLHILCMLLVCAGCASTGGREDVTAGRAAEEPPDLDAIFARRFVLEDFENRLQAARTFYDTGSQYLFISTRDSLISDVNVYIRANPHAEAEPEFARILNRLATLDTLALDDSYDDQTYAARDDSLALSYADWPDIDIELDDGVLFSSFDTVFPEITNQHIDFWIKYFTGPGRSRFERAVARMQTHRPTVEPILEEMDVPVELLCLALIESGYSMKAVSRARAVGPWQFISPTAKLYKLRMNWWYDERRDIVASTYAACNYLKDLHGIWNNWFLAFAAYNCGEYRVARQVARQHTENYWVLQLPRQTQRYVPKFLAALYILRDPEKYGMKFPAVVSQHYDEVTVTDATDLSVIAECAEASVSEIQALNPQCLRWSTPPQMEVILRVPPGRGDLCQSRLDSIPSEERVSYRRHRVRKGQTLSVIARQYGTSITALKQLNGIRNRHFIREGKYLLVPMKGASGEKVAASKPQYKKNDREINKAALEKYAQRGAPPQGYKRTVYTVKDKDTLGEIAEAYHTSARKIRSWNNLRYRSFIYPGQKLVIYVSPKTKLPSNPQVASARNPDDGSHVQLPHIVKQGETLYSISKLYQVTVGELIAWNNKSKRGVIRPGEQLIIWKKK